MSNDKLKSEANPSLVVLRDNKPKWYLPETRREGYRNLHLSLIHIPSPRDGLLSRMPSSA